MQKPELLVPVGNPESFYAALKGGADAIYLGLKNFNARGRAKNFTDGQLMAILKECRKASVKVYLTLNTVIKNQEIPELLQYLHFLDTVRVDGVIIQDWGVYFIARRFFPGLALHASTQMGIHNSVGANFAGKLGMTRVVLARELTLKELRSIAAASKVETEVFVHGALCYSFSGMCLYSSYAGGRGANRGLCTQPCRRACEVGDQSRFLFNLKDNQQIDRVDDLSRMGINSLKIEGRMKSGEYTYRVTKAYREVLDDKSSLPNAKKLLDLDFARQKTSYFLGRDVREAISDKTVAGTLLGKVHRVSKTDVWIESSMPIEVGYRLRFHIAGAEKQESIKVRELTLDGKFYRIPTGGKKVKMDSEVYLSGVSDVKFPSKLEEQRVRILPINPALKQKILPALRKPVKARKEEYFFRISSMEWLKKMNLNELDGLFLNFSKLTWSRFDPSVPFIQKNNTKIYIELPKFIAEGSILFYRELIARMRKAGLKNFVISHLSQLDLLPKGCRVIANENVYVFNDAAAQCLAYVGVDSFCYPQEIDFETLFILKNKAGIVPVYFYPELFFSRMPVSVNEGGDFRDDMNLKIRRIRRDGITRIVPQVPVSISQSKDKLNKNGFMRYLIDLTYEPVSKNRAKTIKNRIRRSEQIQPSTTFNFNKGLK